MRLWPRLSPTALRIPQMTSPLKVSITLRLVYKLTSVSLEEGSLNDIERNLLATSVNYPVVLLCSSANILLTSEMFPCHVSIQKAWKPYIHIFLRSKVIATNIIIIQYFADNGAWPCREEGGAGDTDCGRDVIPGSEPGADAEGARLGSAAQPAAVSAG